MNCSIDILQNSFETDSTPGIHLLMPYATFALSTFVLLFGFYALPIVGLANGAIVSAIGVDATNLLTVTECTSITVSIIGLWLLTVICSFIMMKYFRRGFFTALALALSSYNALRPIPLPAVGSSLVILGLPVATGWSVVLVSSFLGFCIRGNVTRAGRLICAAHGANGICSAFPILLWTAFSVETQIWQISGLYATLFALSFFTQYVPNTSPRVRADVDYGLYI
jgi:hypothetical protein